MTLDRVGLRPRLWGGFVLLIGLTVSLAAIAISQLWSIEAQVSRMNQLSGGLTRVLQAREQTQAMQRTILRYIAESDDALLKQHVESDARVTQLVSESARSTGSAERKRLYGSALDLLSAYRAKREVVIGQVNEIRAERAALTASGDALTAATDKLIQTAEAGSVASLKLAAGHAGSAIQLPRVNAWRFLATGDAREQGAFKAAVAKAADALAALAAMPLSDDLRALVTPVRTGLDSYAATFNGIAGAIVRRDSIFVTEMRPLTDQVDVALESAHQSQAAEFGAARDNAESSIARTVSLQEGAGVLALVAGAAIALFAIRSVAGPLGRMTAAMTGLAGGNLEIAIPSHGRTDEIGALARALAVFRDNAATTQRLDAQQKAEQAAKARRQAAVEAHIAGFEASVSDLLENLGRAVADMSRTARTMEATAQQTSSQAAAVAAATEQASANVQTVASATEELSSSVAEISRQVAHSTATTRTAVEAAERATGTVAELAGAAQRIGEVVQLINDVASQTNLLALNATIEAARAGEAGKGFAVVASEVKSLAGQTRHATEEIAAQIAAMQAATQEAVGAIRSLGEVVDTVRQASTVIATAVEEQTATTREIARNTQEAAHGTQEVSATIADVNQAATDTGTASAQVLAAAGALGEQAETLRGKVSAFLAAIRAA